MTAEEIKQEMREAVAAHNASVAARTAQQAVDGLRQAIMLSPLNYAVQPTYNRENVEALLTELEPFLVLLAELAPTLPAKALPVAEEHAPAQEGRAA